jgi:hypothetical protein
VPDPDLDTSTRWTSVSATRCGLADLVGEDKLVCFGGMSDTEPMSVHNDIWFFDCNTRRWLPRETAQDPSLVPLPRYAHLSAVSRGKLVISGGQHSDNS